MAQFLKPSNLNNVWASGGDRIYPGDTKYASGWGVEIPPRQYFNEIDYKQDQMLAHLNQHGIPVWDATTEYQANKSYVQGSTGTIFQCVLTHVGQDPELDTADTYWRIAFAAAGDFYTKTEADAAFITPSELSAYSYEKTETYTKTEVNNKTTVASALQAQQQTSNTTLLTPLRLADAFKGSNQSLADNGFCKLPGGLIIQWGYISATNPDTSQNVVFPLAFTTVFSCTATFGYSGARQDYTATAEVLGLGNTGFAANRQDIINSSGVIATGRIYWVAFGV